MPFLSNIGTTEIILIAVVLLVLFGGKKMGEWARGIGEIGRELKAVKKEFETTYNSDSPTDIDKTSHVTAAKPKSVESVKTKDKG